MTTIERIVKIRAELERSQTETCNCRNCRDSRRYIKELLEIETELKKEAQ